MSTNSVYELFLNRQALLEVGVDDIKAFVRNTNNVRAIGTRGLNGCTCVVILGNPGIVLAHISPYSGHFREDDTRDISQISYEHHEQYLRGVAALLGQYRKYFPASSTAWGIFSYVRRGDQPPRTVNSIIQQVQAHLSEMGYSMTPEFYEEKDISTIRPPMGEVVAYFDDNGVAQLYVEHRKVWPQNQQMTTRSSSIGSSSSAKVGSSNEWWGYPLIQNSQHQLVLSCTVLDKKMNLPVRWLEGQSLPAVFAFGQWRQTESSGNILIVRINDTTYRVEKPQE
ncbi:hypothetical protein LTR37_015933 [Vermiconidia calcicola]|uniref:Uncharacterized protein n=1 Tax=Vermiconidia calcicola TaxID=1690605 RepID=A0ACC3MQI8_9PEZI|nr:hypothetical protein LTR37_015933 [Vermiconidia calcicola]